MEKEEGRSEDGLSQTLRDLGVEACAQHTVTYWRSFTRKRTFIEIYSLLHSVVYLIIYAGDILWCPGEA